MPIKSIVDSLESVPENLRELYTEKDGKFHIGPIEGLAPAEKVREFRDTNIALAKQLEDLTKKFSGVDLEAYGGMVEQQRKLRDKELIDSGKVEELFAERMAPMRTAFEKDLGAAKEHSSKLQAQLETLLIDGAIRDAASKVGVRATAVDDVLLRGRQAFKLQDGKAVPMDGDKMLYGKGGDPMSVDEWVSGLADRAPHLFEPSQGGGAANARANLASGGKRIQAGDNAAFLANLKDIASRKIQVQG
jgi:hypothetical protein